MVATPPTRVGGIDAVLTALGLLADRGADGRADVLRLVLRAVPTLRSLTLRGADGVVAAATRPSPAGERRWALELPVGARGTWTAVLSAVSSEPLTADDAALLRGIADAFAVLGYAERLPPEAAARALLDAEADLALVAAELDETVAESIVALRHTDPDKVRAAAAASLVEVRRIGRRLRAQALGDGLRAALGALAEWGAVVHAADPALDEVPPAVAVLVERVAEAACRSAVGKVRIAASVGASMVKLAVESADNEIDASEVERWRRRARALHGELRHWTDGVELTLPTATATEGRHDDGPDLRRPPHGP